MVRGLLIIGAPGSGKSTVLDRLGTLLEIDRVPYGAVECDELARGWPYPAPGEVLARLAAMTALHREAGLGLVVVVATPETDVELEHLIDAIGADRMLVICLRAPAEVVAARVGSREPDEWPGKLGLVAHSRDLALTVPRLDRIDVIVDSSERPPAAVSHELHRLLSAWLAT